MHVTLNIGINDFELKFSRCINENCFTINQPMSMSRSLCLSLCVCVRVRVHRIVVCGITFDACERGARCAHKMFRTRAIHFDTYIEMASSLDEKLIIIPTTSAAAAAVRLLLYDGIDRQIHAAFKWFTLPFIVHWPQTEKYTHSHKL